MRKEEILIVERNDMFSLKNGKDIRIIDYYDFDLSKELLTKNGIILFIDNNGDTKILKNRYGDNGNNSFIRTIEDMKNNSIDNELRYGDQYFDDIISIFK